jgi:hypothetical protein
MTDPGARKNTKKSGVAVVQDPTALGKDENEPKSSSHASRSGTVQGLETTISFRRC